MPFMTLNGHTIPIKRGGQLSRDVIGSRGRSFNGGLIVDRRYVKNRWKFETPTLTEMVAKEIEGIVEGKGQHWNFNGDLYSSKGVAPVSSTAVLVPGLSADLLRVSKDTKNVSRGMYAVAVEGAKTNLVTTSNQRTGTDASADTSGFGTVGSGSIATTTDASWRGSRSLEVTMSGAAGDGCKTADATITSATVYTASVYVRPASALKTVTIDLIGDVGGSFASISVACSNAEWTRVSVTGTSGGSDTTARLEVRDDAGSAYVLYCDGFAIEADPESLGPTAWYDGARSASNFVAPLSGVAPAITFPNGSIPPTVTDFSIHLWFYQPTAQSATARYLFEFTDANLSNYLRRNGASDTLELRFGNGGFITHTPTWNTSWHHVAVVSRYTPETGEVELELYYDGSSVGTDAITIPPQGFSVTDIGIGCTNAGASHFNAGLLSEVFFLPYAMTANHVAAVAGDTQYNQAALPRQQLNGDVVHDGVDVEVEGLVTGGKFKPLHIDGTWRANSRSIEFELWEV